MNNGQHPYASQQSVTPPGTIPVPQPRLVAEHYATQPLPHYIPHPEAYAPGPTQTPPPVLPVEENKKSLVPAVGVFLAVLIVGFIAFQQVQIVNLQQQVTGLRAEITDVRQDLTMTSQKADTAMAAIRRAEALQDKVCTIPLIGGLICSWLGLQAPATR